MYTYFRSQGFKAFMVQEVPYFLAAFIIANFFYKFHSFGLELFAFMGTWLVFSAVGNAIVSLVQKQRLGREN